MTRCLWCGQSFEPRKGGKPQRFCGPTHRRLFHIMARRWAERAVDLGLLTADDLRGDPSHVLSSGHERPSED